MTDKYVQEIEEILKKAEASDNQEEIEKSKSRRFANLPGGKLMNKVFGLLKIDQISSRKVMIVGLSILVLALLLNALMPGGVHLLIWTGLVLIVVTYGVFVARPGLRHEKRWRGRVIEETESLNDKLKKWFRSP